MASYVPKPFQRQAIRPANGHPDEGRSMPKRQAGPCYRRAPSPWTPPPPSPDPGTGLETSIFVQHQELYHPSRSKSRYSTSIPQVKTVPSGMKNRVSSAQAGPHGLRGHTSSGSVMVPQPRHDGSAGSPLSNLPEWYAQSPQMEETHRLPRASLSDALFPPSRQAPPPAHPTAPDPNPRDHITWLPKGDSKCTPVVVASLTRRGAIRHRPGSQPSRSHDPAPCNRDSTSDLFFRLFR